jgi:hypothetical protein
MIYSSKTLRIRLNNVQTLSSSSESKTGYAFYYTYDNNNCEGNVNYISAIARDKCMTIYDKDGFPVASVKTTCNDRMSLFVS